VDLIITFTDDEISALRSEQQPDEQLLDVVKRLISPLVARAVATKFNSLLDRFKTAPVEKQAQVIAVLEKLTF
jgi:hypothetical protein